MGQRWGLPAGLRLASARLSAVASLHSSHYPTQSGGGGGGGAIVGAMARLARFVHEGLFLRVWLGWVGVQRLASPRGLERFVGLVLLGWAGLAGWFALRHRRIDTFLIRSQPTLIIAIAYLAISRHGRTNEAFSFGHRPPGVLHRIHSVRHLHLHLHPHHEAIIMIDVVINVTVQDLVFFFFYLFFSCTCQCGEKPAARRSSVSVRVRWMRAKKPLLQVQNC